MRSALKSRLDHQLAPASDGPRVSPREREWSEPNRTVSKSPGCEPGAARDYEARFPRRVSRRR